jgi:hypothetical protein
LRKTSKLHIQTVAPPVVVANICTDPLGAATKTGVRCLEHCKKTYTLEPLQERMKKTRFGGLLHMETTLHASGPGLRTQMTATAAADVYDLQLVALGLRFVAFGCGLWLWLAAVAVDVACVL